MRSNWHWFVYALLLVGGALIGHGIGVSGPPVYSRVEVPVEKIREVERVDTVVQFKERIVYRTAKPVTVATAEGGGRGDVERFCADTVRVPAVAVGDAVNPDEPVRARALLLRSARTEAGWFFRPDRVVLTGPLSDGGLRQLTYSARPGWQAHVQADTALFQSPRFWWVREGIEAGTFIGLGYLIAKVF